MLQLIDTATGGVIGIAEALNVDSDSYLSIRDMAARLLEQQAAGAIRIEPSGAALQTEHVRKELERFTAKARGDDGIRQYAADRRGGRINRLARLSELEAVHRRETIASIQRYMLIEGPAAYESQAALLGALDPSVDTEFVARQSSEAVGNAVRTGIERGKSAVSTTEQTG